MKTLLIIAAVSSASVSNASGTVCAGPSVHYVDLRKDFGAPPPEGVKLGEVFLSDKGLLLGKVEHFMGKSSVGTLGYNVRLRDEKTLAKDGGLAMGWRVFSAELFAEAGIDSRPITDHVICRTSWAHVP